MWHLWAGGRAGDERGEPGEIEVRVTTPPERINKERKRNGPARRKELKENEKEGQCEGLGRRE